MKITANRLSNTPEIVSAEVEGRYYDVGLHGCNALIGINGNLVFTAHRI
jgi:hypothetical protein